jgi:hypothetical protein
VKKPILIALFLCCTHVYAVDADGFFVTKPMQGFLGNLGTEESNGVLRALWKMDGGIIKICMEKKRESKDCDTSWVSPEVAVEKIAKNACYMGFELNGGNPVFYYRVNRSCS